MIKLKDIFKKPAEVEIKVEEKIEKAAPKKIKQKLYK